MNPSYLSNEFYSLVSAVLEVAEQTGLSVRLADDFSNSWVDCFQNELTKNPKARACALKLVEQRLVSEKQEFILSHYNQEEMIIIAVKEQNGVIEPASVTDVAGKATDETLRWQVPEGTWRICIFSREYVLNPAGGYVPNPFYQKNSAAYIQNVLEPFKEQYSKYMPGVFNGFINEMPSILPAKNSIPWDDDLVVKFRSKSKKNLLKLLPAIFCDNYPGSQKNRQQIYSFIHETMGERFIAPLEEWAKKNKVHLWTLYPERSFHHTSAELADGYVVPINDLGSLGFQNIDGVENNAVLLRVMADVNATEFRRETVTVIGRNRTGTGSTLQSLKSDVDRVLMAGATRIIIDGFFTNGDQFIYGKTPISPEWYTPEGGMIHDLCTYISRYNEIIRSVHWNRQIAVLSPVSEIMASYLPADGTASITALDRMKRVCETLERSGYSYDLVTEQLLTSCSIRSNGEFGTADRIRKGNYQALIIPYAPELSRNVLIFIEKLVQKEGCVIFIEQTPSGTIEDGISATMTSRYEKILGDRHKTTGVATVETLEEYLDTITPAVNILHNGKSTGEIVTACGVKENNDICVFYNISAQKDLAILTEVVPHTHFYMIDCESGTVKEVVPVERLENVVRFKLTLAPMMKVILVGTSNAVPVSGSTESRLSCSDPFSASERSYRILMKDQWTFSTTAVNNYPLTAWNIRIGLSRESGGFSHFHESHFQVKTIPSQCRLLLNLSGLGCMKKNCQPLEITVNGSKVETIDAPAADTLPGMEKTGQVDDTLLFSLGSNFFVYDIHDFLVRGVNRISMRTTEHSGVPGIMLYPPLLCGDFRLSKGQNGGVIDKMEETMVPGSWVKSGFPCLCGTGTYRQSFELPNEYEKLVLCFPYVSGAIEVAMNGKELGVYKWQPMCVDITPACEQRRNELTIRVVNSIDTLLRMNGRPSGLIGDVYLDVY